MSLRTRKIILWSTVSVAAIVLLSFWAKSIPEKLSGFQGDNFLKELDIPEIEMPDLPEINLEELEKLYGQEEATTTE